MTVYFCSKELIHVGETGEHAAWRVLRTYRKDVQLCYDLKKYGLHHAYFIWFHFSFLWLKQNLFHYFLYRGEVVRGLGILLESDYSVCNLSSNYDNVASLTSFNKLCRIIKFLRLAPVIQYYLSLNNNDR